MEAPAEMFGTNWNSSAVHTFCCDPNRHFSTEHNLGEGVLVAKVQLSCLMFAVSTHFTEGNFMIMTKQS